MALDQRLAELNTQACKELPAQEIAVMQRASATLRKSGITEQCLQAGESAPEFTVKDQYGNSLSLEGLLKKGPVVINFFRGFWCDYCKAELKAYQELLQALQNLNTSYLAISPNTPSDNPSHTINNYFQITDTDNRIAKKFGIVYEVEQGQKELFSQWGVDLAKLNHGKKWELPLPATYIISKHGCVDFKFVHSDYRKRLEPLIVLERLQELQA
ncbi:MAG: peroxiredoxin-like family protein [Bermanella sp.]